MNELFRFILLRSPKPEPKDSSIKSPEDSAFIKDLEQARKESGEETPRNAIVEKAREFLQEKELRLYYKDEYEDMLTKLKDKEGAPNFDKIKEVAEQSFGKNLADLVEDDNFVSDKTCLYDFLHAIKIVAKYDKSAIRMISCYLHLIYIVEKLEKASKRLEKDVFSKKGIVLECLTKPIQLSSRVFPLPSPFEGNKHGQEEPETSKDDEKLEDLIRRSQLIEKAIEELMTFQENDFKKIPIEKDKPNAHEDQLFDRIKNLENSVHLLLSSQVNRELDDDKLKGLVERNSSEETSAKKTKSIPGAENYAVPTMLPLILKEESINKIGTDVKNLVAEFTINLGEIPVPEVVARLENELEIIVQEISRCRPKDVPKVLAIGNRTYQKLEPKRPKYTPTTYSPTMPNSRGEIRSVGIGDLLIVKEQIKGYEVGEIAHIENILKGEFKKRIHRKLKRSEETFIIETERISDEEQELTTTERFELQQESSKVISKEVSNRSGMGFSVSAGVSGGGLGFSYYIDGNLNGNFENASTDVTEAATRKATNFSKDVTTKAASRITERTRKEQIRAIIREVEEVNEHGIDNSGGTINISGIYQWINKLYEAQIYNYGRRMLFDFMIPEPSAYLRKAIESNTPEGIAIEPPIEFTIEPNELNKTNYHLFVKHYNVTGVQPPPVLFKHVAKTFNGKTASDEEAKAGLAYAVEVDIPSGYKLVSASIVGIANTVDPGGTIEVGISHKNVRITPNDTKILTFPGVVGKIPVVIVTWAISSFAVGVELKCQRTSSEVNRWQLETYDAIKQQYLNLKAEYDERIAAAQIQEGVRIQGRNPEENRRIERTELKKNCLSILTNQHFESFDSIISPNSSPEVNIPKSNVEGKYIRFFEQAFDWEHMMTVYYPYFWSRKPKWLERILIKDTDPLHAEFLKAGSARVVVAVSENFELAVTHFLETGEIPEDEELLNINSPLYRPIVEEIKNRQGARGEEIRQGDPWEVKLPTSLVKLKSDDSLPEWEKSPDGNWNPKP